MVELDKLRLLTQEIAHEIEQPDGNTVLSLIKLIFDQLKTMVAILDKDMKILYTNKAIIKGLKKYYSMDESVVGKDCKALNIIPLELCNNCPATKALNERKVVTTTFKSNITSFNYYITCIPLFVDHVTGIILIWEKEK